MKLSKKIKWKENVIAFAIAMTIPLNMAAASTGGSKKVTTDDMNTFIEKLEKIELKYYFKPLSLNTETPTRASKCTYEITENSLIQEVDKIVSKIAENSKELAKENPDYEEPTKEMLDIARIALMRIITNSSNDISEDLCKLQDISITIGNSEDSEILSGYDGFNDNAIIYYDNIKAYSEQKEREQDSEDYSTDYSYDKLTEAITHELNHARQFTCDCNEEELTIASSYSSSYPTFLLLETSAESALYNQHLDPNYDSKKSFNYRGESERQYESLLFLLGLMRDNVNINDYYNAVFNSDLNALYQFLGADSEEEIIKLQPILYSLEILTKRIPVEKGYEQITVGKTYKADIFKLVIENMIAYTTTHPELSLEENLALLNVVKNTIAYDSSVLTQDLERESSLKLSEYINEEFIQKINQILNIYIDFLSEHYNVNLEGIYRIMEGNNYTFECTALVHKLPYESFNTDKAVKLLEKYPLLSAILYPNYIQGNEFDNLTNNNTETLTR